MTKEELAKALVADELKNFLEEELDADAIANINNKKEALAVLMQAFVAEAKACGIKFIHQMFPEYKALQHLYTADELIAMGIPPLTDEEIEDLRDRGIKI